MSKGTKLAPSQHSFRLAYIRHKDHCDDILPGKYKFFLAFENTICKDYVTEKVYNVLQMVNKVQLLSLLSGF